MAQSHFQAGNYTRALSFVAKSDLLSRSPACKYLAAHCYIKQDRHEDALALLGDKNPTHLVTTTDSVRRKLQHVTNGVQSKKGGKQPHRVERVDRSEERDREDSKNFKYEAGMCHLRGLCHAKHNAFDKAKQCYKDAVGIDIQCFEAFDQLMKNSLMAPGEEWDFLESLDFDTVNPADSSAPEAADFTRQLYTTRLSKYARPETFTTAIETLGTHYHLQSNPDILLARAESLAAASQTPQALQLTTRILSSDPYNPSTLPLHIALLHSSNASTALFALAHDLADTAPDSPTTWLAVGTYYLNTSRIPEARSYFSKASLMDPHFGPAWIGFAHTFAAEGENDQAVAAYSTAARLFQGTHLPQLFLGMQEIALGELGVAREYLSAAYALCDRDPLLLNELGVVAYMEDDYPSAIRTFSLALQISHDNGTPPQTSAPTRLNLAHAYRRSGSYVQALEAYDECLRLGLKDAGVFASKALVLMEEENWFEAVVALHEALAIAPQDPVASDLLGRALGELRDARCLGSEEVEGVVDAGLGRRLREIRERAGGGGKKGGRRRGGGWRVMGARSFGEDGGAGVSGVSVLEDENAGEEGEGMDVDLDGSLHEVEASGYSSS